MEEAREVLDRQRGRTPVTRHNTPDQLQIVPGMRPAVAAELLFGPQQHPRVQQVIQALQRSGGSRSRIERETVLGGGSGGGNTRARSAEAAAGGGQTAAVQAAAGAVTSGLGSSSSNAASAILGRGGWALPGGPHFVPAWPEYVSEANATAADVNRVSAADALGWLRSLARGAPTVSCVCLCVCGGGGVRAHMLWRAHTNCRTEH